MIISLTTYTPFPADLILQAGPAEHIPIANGLVSVTLDGTISISCIDGHDLRKVVSRPTGRRPQRVFVVGDRIVYEGSELDRLSIATFVNPCR